MSPGTNVRTSKESTVTRYTPRHRSDPAARQLRGPRGRQLGPALEYRDFSPGERGAGTSTPGDAVGPLSRHGPNLDFLNRCHHLRTSNHQARSSQATPTFIEWDLVSNAYSTDAILWTFIGGNPQHVEGETTFDVQGATSFTRLKIPSVLISFTCPWGLPAPGTEDRQM
jgi:hypothetical protein